ncbi:TetR/AcrR family transcriptional regulator [Paenibacillus hamazuiensis]|uniref:TetR/AcrR family transcriptional regulator n=1 Tax=Paenibacillus hamazuiensis TaxID=2936508 RepID=UPI00200C664E|nr:TetR/AcrR family transcriptional regulator [Paenibacillus hamazuiensis]
MAYRQGLDKTVVLRAAAEIADSVGLEQVTLAALAQKLNVKTPSLYNHVNGLPGLRKELALHGLTLLKEELADAVLGKAGDDALLAVGWAFVTFARNRPGLYEATISAPDPQDPELVRASEDVVGLLYRILEPYRLSTDDAVHVIRGLRSLVHGFAMLELKHGFGMDIDRDESLRRLLAIYIAGIGGPKR